MKEYALIQILRKKEVRIPYVPQVGGDVFVKLAQVAFDGGICGSPPAKTERKGLILINALLPNSAFDRVVELLRIAGWHPEYRCVRSDCDDRYQIRRVREYDVEDLDSAELLYVGLLWGDWPIAEFVSRNGQRWVGDVNKVGNFTGLGWKQPIGYVNGSLNHFVNDWVREEMEKARLRGLRFHPLEWNEPEKARARFWELDTDFRMPECLLPVADIGGYIYYDGDGYEPVELRYSRREVAAMGEFDLAWTREEIGDFGKPNWGRHLLVVSQAFRKTISTFEFAAQVTFYPVRLV
jgi:hypothetical protein